MRYALLGANGQLARDLAPRLPGEVIPLTRQHVDLARPDSIRPGLTQVRPDAVVNCAAYNFVDRAESEAEAAFAVNAWGVRELAGVCRDLGCPLVHFSSDYVFGLDDKRRRPYREADAPGPVNVYGLSKLAGEYLVRAASAQNLVIRTCGLYGVWGAGGKGGNFVETMLKLAAQGKPLRVVNDQICTPSYTVDVAVATATLIQERATGIQHLTNAKRCTWYELAKTIFELEGVPASLTPITSQEFGAAARRPRYSVLESSALRLRPWKEALQAYLQERKRRT